MYKQELLLLGKRPICNTFPKTRRSDSVGNNKLPSHDPYIPRTSTFLYNCSSTECVPFRLVSLTQISSPELQLKSCHAQSDKYECETIRYNYFKNIDKLLFLANNIKNKKFYLVDCLVYSDRERVCHEKDEADSHTKLVGIGTVLRPNDTNALLQDEFICEDGEGFIHCDINSLVPYSNGLKVKELVDYKDDILLKTDNDLMTLTKNCIGHWCGFTRALKAAPTRRVDRYYDEAPGGKLYRCYYANKQQVYKLLTDKFGRAVYKEQEYLSN